MTKTLRPFPWKAKGTTITDANGQPLGSTSDPDLTKAVVEAINEANDRAISVCDHCGCNTMVALGNSQRCLNCGNELYKIDRS